MGVTKDPTTGLWRAQFRYVDWTGQSRKTGKRGFKTKREAEDYIREFMQVRQGAVDMPFREFVKLYFADMEHRLRETTIRNKKYVVELKILPYFGERKMCDISPADIRAWQNTLLKQGYAETYLRTIHNQLSCLFNYAVRYYNLRENPCRKAGSMGKNKADEMLFWTKQEFMRFIEAVMDKHQAYIAFMVLYWTGIRIGELLALTLSDIDFSGKTISITKSYQRIDDRDVITPPKTPKGKRVINIPQFLVDDLRDYTSRLYALSGDDRIFPFTKHFMEHEMRRGVAKSGVKHIRIHDIRHSHASLLVEMGFTPLEIAERLGHERIETTLSTYSHLYPNKQSQLADRLDKEYREEL